MSRSTRRSSAALTSVVTRIDGRPGRRLIAWAAASVVLSASLGAIGSAAPLGLGLLLRAPVAADAPKEPALDADQFISAPLKPTPQVKAASVTVQTDEAAYLPNSAVTVTGAGWLPGTIVELTFAEMGMPFGAGGAAHSSAGVPVTLTAAVGGNGEFASDDFVTGAADDGTVTVQVTARGVAAAKGVAAKATTSFTNGSVLTTERDRYSAGDRVFITGAGFTPGAAVDVTITRPDGSTVSIDPPPVASDEGTFVTAYDVAGAGGRLRAAGKFGVIAIDSVNGARGAGTQVSLDTPSKSTLTSVATVSEFVTTTQSVSTASASLTGASTSTTGPIFTNIVSCPTSGTGSFYYPTGVAPNLSSVVFNESSVLKAFGADSLNIIAWYNDEHALTLGVRQVVVTQPSGAVATNSYPFTAWSASYLTGNAGFVQPAVGTTCFKDSAACPVSTPVAGLLNQAGTDTATWSSTYVWQDHGRPDWPALFITDITDNADNKAGDWQNAPIPASNQPSIGGGYGYGLPPFAVYGTWKGAVRAVNLKSLTSSHATITTTPDADPAKNGFVGLPDQPPVGTQNEGYGAEIVWDVTNLPVQNGHRYRMQFMVHDGDQNKTGGDSGEGCMQVTVNGLAVPALTLQKSVLDGTTLDYAGQIVTYNYKAINTGDSNLIPPYSIISDDKISPEITASVPGASLSCNSTPNPIVPTTDTVNPPAGSFFTCVGHYVVTQADVDAGALVNHAQARAIYKDIQNATANVDSNVANATVLGVGTQTLGITKTDSLNGTHYTTVGQVVTYTITSTNTGTGTLHQVTVSDDPALTGFACKVDNVAAPLPVANLAPGKAIVCTGTHSITAGDLDTGSFLDTAHASATGVTDITATDTIHGDATQTLGLTKTDSLNGTHYTTFGQVVTYTITATNTGTMTLHAVTVSDTPTLTDFACKVDNVAVTLPVADLAPGKAIVCTGTHAISQADLDSGSVLDTAHTSATGVPEVNTPDTITGDQTKTLGLTKTARVKVITYSFVITNTGNTTLSGVQLTDALAGYTNQTCEVSTLAPSISAHCSADYDVKPGDIDANGNVTNHATATATGVTTNPTASVIVKIIYP
jgi:uncharacterized repeat protein (TIGR01451 family)